jgi:glycosyltransferase involved in cell wall biosynthesis
MRINWFSNAPWGASGYSNQTALFAPLIKEAGHDISLTCFWGLAGGNITWQGLPCFPGMFDGHGQDIMIPTSKVWQSDILLTLYDIWVMKPNEKALKEEVKFVPWFPVDHDPIPSGIVDMLKVAFYPIAMTKSGQKAANDAGISKVGYVPHGVDTNIFFPRHRALARKSLGMPKDAFIVSLIAMNKGIPSRKAFTQQLEGFARFSKNHPDALLYMHTLMTPEMQGYNLHEVVNALGIADKIMSPDQYQYMLGYPRTFIADVYNASDVCLHATMGEGFGVGIIEAQACGTPVIIGDWTAMSELLRAGWALDRETMSIAQMTPLGTNQFIPSPIAIQHFLEQAYDQPEKERLEARKVAATAIKEEYDYRVVFDKYWRKELRNIERKLIDEKTKNLRKGVPANV